MFASLILFFMNPVAKAICILKPPVKASTSNTSPQNLSLETFLLSI